jgi:hypothetical protein
MASNLKEKHNIIIRNAVRAVAHLQSLMDDDNTPEHLKPRLLACLDLLDRGLLCQPLDDERVVIEVIAGIAYVASKTEYVEVVINDLDEGWGKAL